LLEPLKPTEITEDILFAAESLRAGRLVAFPTETVFGLGADATNSRSVERLFEAKGRPSNNPLIVHLGSLEQLSQASPNLPSSALRLLESYSPGPITVVVPKHPRIPSAVSAGLDTVGIRIPDHPQANQLLQLVNCPVAAPSANLSGRPSGTTWQAVLEDLDGRIDLILKGDVPRVGIESTVVDCTGEFPVILRTGAVTLEQIQSVLPAARQWQDLPSNSLSMPSTMPSPGLLHAHYQPKAKVILLNSWADLELSGSTEPAQCAYLSLRPGSLPDPRSPAVDNCQDLLSQFGFVVQFISLEEYARGFYEALRMADRKGITRIYIQLAPSHALGAALRDRQLRAAGGQGRLF
jgi:L-threonylcarbamoyladenylate synthase